MNHSKTPSSSQTSLSRLGARVVCGILLLAVLLLPSAETRAANTVVTAISGNLLDAASWSPGPALPSAANDALFDVNFYTLPFYLGTGGTYGNLTVGSINFLNTSGTEIQDYTSGGTENDSILTLGGGTGNSVPGANTNDLVYITNGVNIFIHGENGLGWPSLLRINLVANGNFDIASGASAIISAEVSGTGFGLNRTGGAAGALTVTGNLSFTGGFTNTAGFYTNSGLSTYAGPTVFKSGTNVYFSIASVGAGASALGAPTTVDNGVIHYLGGTLYYNGAADCTSDRILNWSGGGSFYNNSLTGKLFLTGGITNSAGQGASFRGNGTNVVTGLISIGAGAVTRTDGGLVILTNQLNQFSGNLSASDGYFYIDTIANSGVACSMGTGNGFNLGQGNGNTVGKLQLGVTNGSSCNRAITITAGAGTGTSGGTIENTIAGRTVTFSGNVTSVITNFATGPVFTLTGAGNGVLSGVLGINTNTLNSMSIVKSGAGTWTISGLNTNRGAVTVSAGTLLINGDSSIATNTVTVASGATFGGIGTNGGNVVVNSGGKLVPGGLNAVGTLTLTNNLTLNGGTLYFDLSNVVGTGDQVVAGNALNVSGVNNIILSFPNGTAPAGTYTLITNISKSGSGSFALQGSYPNASLNITATSVQLVVTGGGTYANNLTWKGNVSGTWDTVTGNWATNGVGGALYADGNNVFFDDTLTANPVVSSGGTVSPSTVSFLNNSAIYTIGAAIGGTGTTLTKGGTAATVLTGTNSYTGNTTVNAGSLVVSNGGAIYSPNATLNVGPASISGTATLGVGGAVTARQLLATNVVMGGLTNSFLNLSGGALLTSNAANAIAASIYMNSNASFTVNSSWTMNGGTNLVVSVNTNMVTLGAINIGNNANNVVVTVNSNAVFTTQNPWNVNNTTSTNMVVNIGVGSGFGGNLLIVTNGGRFITRANVGNGAVGMNLGGAGNSANGIIVAGTDGLGNKAILDFAGISTPGNGNRLILGGNQATSTNNFVIVGAGGVITNINLYCYNGWTNGMTITNGGQVYLGGGVCVGRTGTGNYLNVAGADSAGNRAMLAGANNFGQNNDLWIGGSGGGVGNAATYCSVTIGQNGWVTNINRVMVGPDTNSLNNSLTIANGGQLFSATASMIGAYSNANNNSVSIGGSFGPTNALWNLSGKSLTIGGTNGSLNNFVTLSTGGLLTNVSTIWIGGGNTMLTFNGGTLAAATNGMLISTNAGTDSATNFVQASGAFIDTGVFTVANGLPMVEDPSSTGGGLTKLGVGTLVLSNVNTYTGGTVVSAGRLVGVSGGASAGSAVTVLPGATNSVQLIALAGQWTCAGLTNYNGSTLDINFGSTPSVTTAPLSVTGAFALTNANIAVRTIPTINVGQYPLVKYGSFFGTLAPATLSLPVGMVATLSNNVVNKSVDLVVTTGYTTPFAFYWAVGNGNWDFATMNWKDTPAYGVTNLIYTNNAPVVLDDSAGGSGTILVTNLAPVSPSSMVVDVTADNYTISGAAITGNATLTKTNLGTLTLNNPNSYSGNTLVNGGTLVVADGGAIYSPTNMLNIGAGATLATNILAGGGAITVQTLLATNVNMSGANNSILNLNGGTLITSNAATGIAATINVASNVSFAINSAWSMNGGTNLIANVNTNANSAANVFIGNVTNNVQVTVNTNAMLGFVNFGSATNPPTLYVGNSGTGATNNSLTVNGGLVRNARVINIGNNANSVSNSLSVLNGGQFVLGTNPAFSSMNGNYNSLIVGGTSSAGGKSLLDFGGSGDRRVTVSGSNSNLIWVGSGGVISNASFQVQAGIGNGVIVTNGGQLYLAANFSVGRQGGLASYAIVGGTDAAGNNSLVASNSGSGAQLLIACSGNVGGLSTNNWVRVDRGGVVKVGNIYIGGDGPDTNNANNFLIITNGGQVSVGGASFIGAATNTTGNWIYVGGNFGATNSTLNQGGTLTIGATTLTQAATNNYVFLDTNGVLTIVNSVVLGGVNSKLVFNGGTLAAGTNCILITTNASAVGATNYVQAGGAVIDSATFTVTNLLPLVQDPASTGGGLTKLGLGTLVLTNVNTYTGRTLVSAGMLAGMSGGSSASSAVTVLAGATNSVMTVATNGQWICAALANNNGSTLDINLGTLVPSISNAPLSVIGAFALTNANVSLRSTAIIRAGQFPLVKYGSFSGTLTPATLSLPAGLAGYLSNNTGNASIDLVVTTGFSGLFWKGYVNGVWDDAVNQNWLGSVVTNFNPGNAVVFDDTLVGNTNVTSSAPVAPGAMTVNNSLTNYSIAASIGGTGALTKSGVALVTLSGSNSFSGGVTLNAGTLGIGSSNALGTGVFTISGGTLDNKAGVFVSNVNNNVQIWNSNFTFAGSSAMDLGTGAVTMNNSIAIAGPASVLAVDGNISGTGGLSHSGNSSLTLSGILSFSGGVTNTGGWLTNSGLNTYPGATSLTGGTNAFNSLAIVGQPSALGQPLNAANGVIAVNSTIRYIGTNDSTSDRAFNWIGGTFFNDSLTGKLILTGGITNSSNGNIVFRGGGTNVVSGLISIGGGSVTRTDTGLVIITNQLNPFTGNIQISDGYFYIDTIANFNSACSLGKGFSITLGQQNGPTVGKLQLAVTNGSSCDRAIIISAQTGASGGLIDNTVAGTTVTFNGTVTSQITNTTAGPTLTLTGVGNGVLSGVLGINNNTAVAMNLVKSGAGTWTISGLNTNRGTVTVNAGTLLINGDSSRATNTVTVVGGATFGGSGTNGGKVTLQSGAFATNTVTLPFTIANAVTLNGNTMQVGSLSALGIGDYLLITNTSGGISGSFASGVTVGGAGLASGTSASILTTGSAVRLVVTAGSVLPATGTNITFTPIVGSTFDLSWPTGYIGWELRSNSVDVTLTNYWFVVPGSTTTNRVTITINPSMTNVFYRMQHP